jgi:hypothetical protein
VLLFFVPFRFIPEKITVKEDQMLEYRDSVLNLDFEKEVNVELVEGRYVLPKNVHNYENSLIEKSEV